MRPHTTLPDSVHTIDCHYTAPKHAAAFLVVEGDRALFVDNNTQRALPRLLEALKVHGLTPAQVDYAIITHVHLDHAGGTAALLEACPNAIALAHPKAARHLISPERLVQGAKAVYGETAFAELYGEVTGVAEERVQCIEDETRLAWGRRELRFFHTLGHASHHMCLYDPVSNGVFTGDSFGLGVSPYEGGADPFLVCSSSPPDFDPIEAGRSLESILATGAEWAYLPHFGVIDQLDRAAEMLRRSLAQFVDIIEAAQAQGLAEEALQAFCEVRMRDAFTAHLKWCGVRDVEAALAWLGSDVHINAMGLAHYIRRQARKT